MMLSCWCFNYQHFKHIIFRWLDSLAAFSQVGQGALDSADRLKPSSFSFPVSVTSAALCVTARKPWASRLFVPRSARSANRVPSERLVLVVGRRDDPLVEARSFLLFAVLRCAGCKNVDRVVKTVSRLDVMSESFRVFVVDTYRP